MLEKLTRLALIAAAATATVAAQAGAAETATAAAAAKKPHNVILFVPDGLRQLIVDKKRAPTMAAVRDQGVNFANPHSLFPTFTTANASGMATGHYLGDTGDFSNTIYVGFPVAAAGNSVVPFLENDAVLGEVDEHFGGNYLNEETILAAARKQGLSTAAIGKVGPVLIFDSTDRTGKPTIIVDDATGSATGIPLAGDVKKALGDAGLPLVTPPRGDNGLSGNSTTPGTKVPNTVQQAYFADVATKVVLPMFKDEGKPFVMVYWSRDPDGTQHNQGDSFLKLKPGINGPTSFAAIKNADDNLAQLRATLRKLDLEDTTDIVISADHGFSTISKQSKTSPAAKATYADVPAGLLPPGFLALDLAKALDLPLYDPANTASPVAAGAHTSGNGLLGSNPAKPEVVVAANGGSDLIYLPKRDKALARKIVDALVAQDYVSGVFVDDSFGAIPGTLPLSAINLKGEAVTPTPTIAVNFRSFDTGCGRPTTCGAEVADSTLQQGQGMHGSFSRADTANFMAAIGPSFRKGYVDRLPVSNADVGQTIADILGLEIEDKGRLVGRVMSEAMRAGATPKVVRARAASAAAGSGRQTVLETQQVGTTRYFDAAGFPGRTLGLRAGGGAAAE